RLQRGGKRPVDASFGEGEDFGQLEMRARQHSEEVFEYAGRVVSVDQWRSPRAEGMSPGAHDGCADGNGRLLDRKGNEQPEAAPLFGAVADNGKPHLAILEPRHGRGQKARIEEHVWLDRAGGEIVELLH